MLTTTLCAAVLLIAVLAFLNALVLLAIAYLLRVPSADSLRQR